MDKIGEISLMMLRVMGPPGGEVSKGWDMDAAKIVDMVKGGKWNRGRVVEELMELVRGLDEEEADMLSKRIIEIGLGE